MRDLMAAGGKLKAAAAAAQEEQGLSPLAGHQVFAMIDRVNASVTGTLALTSPIHRSLRVMADKLGIDITAFGPERPKPTDPSFGAFFTSATTDLAVEG